ncbi:hypothetical protein [Hymenobacter swuensis]|uniref:Cytochrome c domain-containing protein n=1 Tax=Hymenobacter swuensis DY53 TaxID=1227739 RepID=W8FBJ0_9BACT|nr:hypothetical protein [Hymenobacter swuensis]AHJ99050.1 hypothetical protein Hsw_3455 [Hymenobacter swuensis DY53]
MAGGNAMSRLVPPGGRAVRGGARPATLLTAGRRPAWGLLLLLAGLLTTSACTYDSVEDLLGSAPLAPACDSTAVSFTGTIAPLLQQQCVSCHNNALRNGNVSLETYAQVQQVAADGRLLGVVTHAPGYPAMPQNQPQLATCDVARLRQWVRAGMPNN